MSNIDMTSPMFDVAIKLDDPEPYKALDRRALMEKAQASPEVAQHLDTYQLSNAFLYVSRAAGGDVYELVAQLISKEMVASLEAGAREWVQRGPDEMTARSVSAFIRASQQVEDDER